MNINQQQILIIKNNKCTIPTLNYENIIDNNQFDANNNQIIIEGANLRTMSEQEYLNTLKKNYTHKVQQKRILKSLHSAVTKAALASQVEVSTISNDILFQKHVIVDQVSAQQKDVINPVVLDYLKKATIFYTQANIAGDSFAGQPFTYGRILLYPIDDKFFTLLSTKDFWSILFSYAVINQGIFRVGVVKKLNTYTMKLMEKGKLIDVQKSVTFVFSAGRDANYIVDQINLAFHNRVPLERIFNMINQFNAGPIVIEDEQQIQAPITRAAARRILEIN